MQLKMMILTFINIEEVGEFGIVDVVSQNKDDIDAARVVSIVEFGAFMELLTSMILFNSSGRKPKGEWCSYRHIQCRPSPQSHLVCRKSVDESFSFHQPRRYSRLL